MSEATQTEPVLGAAGDEGGTEPAEPVLGAAGAGEDKGTTDGGEPAKTGESEGGEGKGAEEGKPESKPEITIPEGAEIDADLLEAVKAGDGQKVVDAYLALQQKQADAWAEQQKQYVAEIRKEWGDKADHNLNLANRALHKFGSEGLVEFMRTTGLANHPEMVRLFHRIAEADAEDTVAGTATAPSKDKSASLRTLYDNSPNLKFD